MLRISRRAVRALIVAFAAGITSLAVAPSAWAHGEKAEEPYQRTQTVAFWDTHFSASSLNRGDNMTITGTLKLLETWPVNLSGGNPKVCYLNVVTPGATFVLRDRTVNGVEAPDSFFCHKGDVIHYSLTIAGRVAGNWHVHPSLAVQGTGTLIGPGQWVDVKPAGTFTNKIKLASGKTVDLESFDTPLVVGFSMLTLVLGMVWLLYWIWSKPTVTRLAVANQLHLNDDGGDAVGLITKKDHRNSLIITAVTVLAVLVAGVWAATAIPHQLPQQTYWFNPPKAAAMPQLTTAEPKGSVWDDKRKVLTMTVHLTNVGKSPIQVYGITSSDLRFINRSAQAAQPGDYDLQVGPGGTVAPGQSQDLRLSIANGLTQNNMIEMNKPQLTFAGLLDVRDTGGNRQMVTFLTDVTPKYNS